MSAKKKIARTTIIKRDGITKKSSQKLIKTTKSAPGQNGWFEKIFAPHIIFLFLSVVFGICFLITIPPFQNPDEIAHFDRAYKLTEFKTFQKIENNTWGDYIPKSIDSVSSKFAQLRWRPDVKTEKAEIAGALQIPLNKSQTKFSNIDAGAYFYFSYLPHLPAVFLGRIFNLNVLYIFYLGRLFALAFYILCVFYAIKIIPVAKYLLTAVAVLPTCLAQGSSFNPDCVLFALTFLMIAILFKQTFVIRKFSVSKDTVLLFAIVLILGILKPVYIPLNLLIFLLPVIHFKTKGRWMITISIAIILSIVLEYVWLKAYGASSPNNSDMASIYSSKAAAFKHNPLMLFDVVKQTFGYFHLMYYQSTIGLLGYLDTVLPDVVYFGFTATLILLSLFGTQKYRLTIKQRLLLFISSSGVMLAVILAMYLLTPNRSGLVAEGVQGRYFIPALFPFLLSFHGIFSGKMDLSRYKILVVGVVIVLLGCLTATEFTLIDRYFG